MLYVSLLLQSVFSKYRQNRKVPLHWLRNPEKQNALLRKIIERVRNSLEPKIVLQAAVDEVTDLLQIDRCCFFWYFGDTNRVQVVCEQVRSPADETTGCKIANPMVGIGYHPLDKLGEVAVAIAQGQMVISSGDLHHSSVFWSLTRWLFPFSNRSLKSDLVVPGAVANLLVPVKSQKGSMGFIACLSQKPRRWSTAEIEFMQLIAQQLEIAVSQAQLYERMQKQAQRERLVNRITAQTRQSFELEKILTEAIAQLLEALQVDRCLVHLVENSHHPKPADSLSNVKPTTVKLPAIDSSSSWQHHLYEVCRPPFPSSVEDFDSSGPITQWVIHNRRNVVITDVTEDQRIGTNNTEYQKAQIKSSLVVPVQTKDALYAILYLNQCSHVRYWSKNDQRLATAVADQLAISVQQAHFYTQAQQQALESAAQAAHLAATLQELQLTQVQLIQSEKLSSLGRMVGGVAHEINNPVNFIYGNIPYVEGYVRDLIHLLQAYQEKLPQPDPELQRLLDKVDPEFLLRDLPQILSSMRAGAERIRQIVLSLRNFSRLDESSRKTVDIHEGIESTLLVLKTQLQEDIELIRQYGELPLVECYPGQLNQVFMNILINAIDALREWKGEHKAIAICTDHVPATGTAEAMVRVVIADNGPGIPHNVQSNIFDPFFTTKEVGQGTGLGLTVSYQTIVNQHGGNLKFYSEPGLGAEFMIEIPVSHIPTLSSSTTPHLVTSAGL